MSALTGRVGRARALLFRRRTIQVITAAIAATLVVLASHLAKLRIHGPDGDLPVAVVALLLAYAAFDPIVDRVRDWHLARRAASRWLPLREKSPLAIDGLATIALTAAVYGAFLLAPIKVPGLGGALTLGIAALVGSYLLVSQINNLMVGTLVRKVHSIGAAAQGPARPTILAFVNSDLARLDNQIKEILSPTGALLDIDDVRFWTQESFALGEGRYDGTDSHLPSAFMRLYPNYLQAHREMLEKHPQAVPNARILIGPRNAMRDDFVVRYDMGYGQFLDEHEDINVKLLYIEEEQAEQLREVIRGADQPLPTTDVALWYGQYALLFREEQDDAGAKVRLWMAFPGQVWYEQCVKWLKEMKRPPRDDDTPVAMPLEKVVPEIFQRRLCLGWHKFVDPNRRIAKLGPFFEHVLDGVPHSILDAAAGIGSDALWLADQGHDVTLNEIEPVYRDIITKRFGKRDLLLFDVDWRKLRSVMGEWFTVVMALGNSICMLMGAEHQRRAIRAFYEVLRSGGRLIIDERNFEHFTTGDIADHLNRNPIRYFPYHGDVMYCGTEVKGCPKSISDTDVVFRYYRNDPDFERLVKDADELDESLKRALDEREIGVLHLYPFKRGELGRLIEECGFVDVTVVRDLEWNDPRAFNEGDWFDADADFFTYIAKKP